MARTHDPWFYRFTLSQFREHVRTLTETELERAQREIDAAVTACDRQGVRGAFAAEVNAKKARIVEREIDARRVRVLR